MDEPLDPDVPDDPLAPDDHWEGPDLSAALRAALEEPDDLRSNARSRVDQTLKGRSLTSTVTDIAGAGIATVWHLLTGAPDPADRRGDD